MDGWISSHAWCLSFFLHCLVCPSNERDRDRDGEIESTSAACAAATCSPVENESLPRTVLLFAILLSSHVAWLCDWPLKCTPNFEYHFRLRVFPLIKSHTCILPHNHRFRFLKQGSNQILSKPSLKHRYLWKVTLPATSSMLIKLVGKKRSVCNRSEPYNVPCGLSSEFCSTIKFRILRAPEIGPSLMSIIEKTEA
jgi:hypothetical protein